MSDIYAIWYAAQIAEGETMQDGLLRVANLMPDVPQPAAVPHPSPELTWLFTHCRAIGMIERSDSGKWEHDIALFTTRMQDELHELKQSSAATAVPPGYALVPIEPTYAIGAAIRKAVLEDGNYDSEVWRKALAAAGDKP